MNNMKNGVRGPRYGSALRALSVVGFAQIALLDVLSAATTEAENSGVELQEVIVTASKSGDQTLQKTPLAIQAFSGEALKEQNITTINDLISSIPGATVTQDNGGLIKAYSIRGVGGASLSNGDSPVGYYIDDIPFSVPNYGIAPPVSFVDLERVEVLRGPQGTLYGQGAEGGIFVFHTKDPDLQNVKVDAETFTSFTHLAANMNFGGDAALSIPVVQDKLAIRISAQYTRNQGYADEYPGALTGGTLKENANFQTSQDVRGVIFWKPIDELQIRAQVWNVRDNDGAIGVVNSLNPPAFLNIAGTEPYINGEFTLYGLSGALDLGSVGINSAAGYVNGAFNANYPIGGGSTLLSQFETHTFTEELRVHSQGPSPLHWIAGATYQDGNGPQRNVLTFPGLVLNTSNGTLTKNGALFGETSYDFLDGKLVPLVGVREYHDERTYVGAPENESSTVNKFTWRANLSYLPTPNLTSFFTVSTGFRAGIVQSSVQVQSLQAAGLPASVQDAPDSIKNYELGLKWRTSGGAIALSSSLYRIEYTDIQVSATGALNNVGGFINLGDAHSNGVDFDATWRTPVEGLSFNAIANWNDSKFDAVIPAVAAQEATIARGNKLVGNAAYNYRFDANYSSAEILGVKPFGNVSYSRMGSRTMIDGEIVPPYSMVGATLGFRKDIWEVALTGENLTDQRGPTYEFAGSQPELTILRPRTVGLRTRVNF